jgi:hypothetical protein
MACLIRLGALGTSSGEITCISGYFLGNFSLVQIMVAALGYLGLDT